jgi:hypothetical protein
MHAQRLSDRMRDGFIKNPLAWILLALLALAEFGNYQNGRDLGRLRELTGPHNVSVPHPTTANWVLMEAISMFQPSHLHKSSHGLSLASTHLPTVVVGRLDRATQ